MSVGSTGLARASLCYRCGECPDLDFVPGLLSGNINTFHQRPTHSLVAALAFGGMAALVTRWFRARRTQAGLRGTVIYASHLLLDFFCQDSRPPYGQPLL